MVALLESPHPFPLPQPNASLLLAHKPPSGKLALIVGTGKLAAARCLACLEAGIRPIVLFPTNSPSENHWRESSRVCDEIRYRVDTGAISFKSVFSTNTSDCSQLETIWDSLLNELDETEKRSIFIVCVTDTLHFGGDESDPVSNANAQSLFTLAEQRAKLIANLCKRRRIPVNVADKPDLCDFSFPATHRFPRTKSPQTASNRGSPVASSLQIAVTTNGKGCRLAGRIRREIVGFLPNNVGDAVEKIGKMRDMVKQEDLCLQQQANSVSFSSAITDSANRKRKYGQGSASASYKHAQEEDLSFDSTPLNSPVPQLSPSPPPITTATQAKDTTASTSSNHSQIQSQSEKEEQNERTKRRMRWVAQMSEYWPIEYLGDLQEEQISAILSTYTEHQTQQSLANVSPTQFNETGRPLPDQSSKGNGQIQSRSQHSLVIPPQAPFQKKKGHIYLLGSGTGHPGLLTVLAHRLLSSPDTHLVLSDKLVPASILRLIPPTTPLEIAKKFPGNAEGAQSELIAMALKAALEEGKTVVRLKQGDPFIYGRGGEEVLAFRKAGIECTVVPGISSALAAPLMLGIPVTQRGAADSMILCTGVGRGGKQVRLPGYERGRTLVILMGVARLKAVIETLTGIVGLGEQPNQNTEGGSRSSHAVGIRDGPTFPPYTPIAIIERASSSDQRIVASTLEGIVSALEKSGEQRPPGMMVIGWSVLSLEGEGDVSILDDASQCLSTSDTTLDANGNIDQGYKELERRDQARVEKWLGPQGFIVREGLDDAYKSALASLVSTSTDAQVSTLLPEEAKLSDDIPAPVSAEEASSWLQRGKTGWASARYKDGNPQGGWIPGESPNRPAKDEIQYAQDREYAEIRARLQPST